MLNMAPAGPYYYSSQTKIYQVDITLKNPMKIVNVNTFLISDLLLLLSRGLGKV